MDDDQGNCSLTEFINSFIKIKIRFQCPNVSHIFTPIRVRNKNKKLVLQQLLKLNRTYKLHSYSNLQ